MSGSKTRAVTLMLLSALSFSIMQVFVKMSSTEVGTFEQVFFRNLVSMIIAGITVYREKLDLIPEIKKGGLTLWGRSFFGFLGIVLFFYATGHARQADVAMLNRASPVCDPVCRADFKGEDLKGAGLRHRPLPCGRVHFHAALL